MKIKYKQNNFFEARKIGKSYMKENTYASIVSTKTHQKLIGSDFWGDKFF